jgi:hypothetical protein
VRFPLRRSHLDDDGPILSVLPPRMPSTEAAAGDEQAPPRQIEPALPFNLPLKSQFTGADSRADRLIRQLRGEVEAIRGSLDQYAAESAEMLEVDLAAVVADPAAAATLPAAALVRALISAAEKNERLRAENETRRRKGAHLRKELRAMRIAEAATNARVETLEEVIAALHANLEDLRAARDHGRAALPPAPAAIELPDVWSAMERE